MSAELDKKRAKGRGNRSTIDGQYHGGMPVYDKTTTPDPELNDKYEYWNEWGVAANWFNYKCKPKDFKNYTVRYAKEYLKLSKDDLKNLKKVKDANFLLVSKLAAIHFTGFDYHIHERNAIKGYIEDLIELGKQIVDEDVDDKPKAKVVSIQDRMRAKVMETIYNEFDETVVEGWFDKDFTTKFDAFAAIKRHDVKGPSIKMFATHIQLLNEELNDAYNKSCEQTTEAYSSWTKPNLKKAIKQLDTILADVEKSQLANKAVRKPRASKPKASDKQVAKLNYLKEDNTAKLASVNPIVIPGAKVLYVYNVKQKKITEFVTDHADGFMVSGSTLKNFDDKLSRTCTLRKPDEVLPQILKKTQKQIDNVFKGLTTKTSVPAGRINKDCIILRVIN
tara:strand:+ start:918 stop:2093 length:1176 start_codon:yes stop_codon:yes gene_type:complete